MQGVSSETGQRVVNGTQMERAPPSFKSFARIARRLYRPAVDADQPTDALQLHATATGGGNRNGPGNGTAVYTRYE